MIESTEQLQHLLKCNPFELFNIKAQFVIDLDNITQTYLALQKQYHPDNGEIKNATLLMLSSHINNSFAILKNPLDRSLQLLEIIGEPLNLSTDTKLPTHFLVSQIELHEQIEEAVASNSISTLEQIECDIIQYEQSLIKQIEQGFVEQNFAEVKNNTKQLAFYNKVKATINATITNLI